MSVTGRLLASVNRSEFSYPVTLLEGKVSVDGTNPIRRKLNATIAARPDSPECDVFRTELRAEYGVSLDNSSWYWFPVGTFVLTDAKEADGGKMTITGEDRWRRVANARFLAPVVTSGKHTDAIKDLMQGADGRILCTDFTGRTSQHNSSIWERDRDKAVRELAKSIGVDVYFNPLGVAEIREVSTVAGIASWTLGEGDGGCLIFPRRELSQGNAYNAVVVEGEDASGAVAVRAVAKITDPNSKLFFGGGFAQRPRYYRSSLITTTAQAQSTAESLLLRVSGVAKTLNIEAFLNPALEVGDTIRVEVDPGVWEYHIVESFTIPLGPGGTTIATRAPSDDSGEQ